MTEGIHDYVTPAATDDLICVVIGIQGRDEGRWMVDRFERACKRYLR